MRTTTIFALACLTVSQAAFAQVYTTPAGYVSETIKGNGAFNLIGLTLHEPIVVSGDVTSLSSNAIQDTDINFDSVLTAGKTYILTFTNGTQDGGVQIITSWGTSAGKLSSELVTGVSLGSLGVTVGDTFILRPAATLSSVFGATNQAGLKTGDLLTADIIWLPLQTGGFAKFYYSAGSVFPPIAAGWKNAAGAVATNQPIILTEAMFIQRREATDLTLTLSGNLEVNMTQVFASAGDFNYVGSIFPIGTTLATSGLQTSLKPGDLLTADILWLQNADRAGYSKYYYTSGSVFPPVSAGWKNSSGADASTVALTSGMIIQRRGLTDIAPAITPPSSYTGL
jgi:hypothetical protein